jgi:serine/threonine-protein kinase HipA
MKQKEKKIWVYADWDFLGGTKLLGVLTAQSLRGKEVFSFEYDNAWLSEVNQLLFLDPNLGFYRGKQYPSEDKTNFGVFLDSAPDRWGRLLMRRREALDARIDGRAERLLFDSDYLLGVFDGHRQGGLRFKLEPHGEFMDNHPTMATPPWTSLRELEHASLQLERADAVNDPEYASWLRMLVEPGSSLGGARPKAGVVDEKGGLWIAKFPSSNDDKNTGAWELVLHRLAKACGIHVPEVKCKRFSGKHHTFLTQRFDRNDKQQRIHFASAMALLGYQDGADYQQGVGYLDLAGFIIQYSASVSEDLEQLWRRMVFNILVSNTDDHLRNHGFLLSPQGWRLSPAYDMNPNELGNGLTLNITDSSNEQDLSLALATARFYQLKQVRAEGIVHYMRKAITTWRSVARSAGIGQAEIEHTARAFRLV